MKKIFTTLLIIGLTLTAMAEQVTNPKAGSLSTVLDIEATEAVIDGPLNGTDILYLRTMLLDHKLTSIDMSKARIVSGGKAYYDTYTTSTNVLGDYAFYECGNLQKLVLPKGLREVGKCSMSKCNKLKDIVIPDTVTVMGMDCLAYNGALRTVTVGRSVGSFKQGVLWSSGAVTDVYMYPELPPTYSNYTFGSKPRVHVHRDSERAYRNAWADLNVTFVADLVDTLRVDYKAMAANLRTFFADDLCSEIAPDYQSMSDDELTAAMEAKGINADLQAMTLKIKNQQWGRYERQFRVHAYQPYSDANTWRSKVKASGLSYMGNPTGIWGRQGDVLYVFVPQEVASGATLYLAGCTDNNLVNRANYGVELTQGLNVIKVSETIAQYWIIYTVTTDNLKKKVSDWPDLDIHIEGGVCDGYYDITHASDEEYQYLSTHATYPLFTIKGEHMIWNFETATFPQVWPKTIDHSIQWGDKQHMWQFELMGIIDDVAAGNLDYPPYNVSGGEALYPSYCNNVTFAIQGDPEDAGWANSTTYRTSYNGLDCIRASLDLENQKFDCWCVAHECGHNNQGAFNLETCTEVSNNLFSNVCLYLTGYLASKGQNIEFESNDFNNDTPWVKRDIWSKMRMYYQLYLYYHMARRNTSFYPELFKELRKDPLTLWKNSDQSTMKFVEKVCKVANEDLTDFFAAWGFFVPCTRLTVDDYGEHTYTLTKRDIDDTLKKIAKYPRKNHEILFIEDRVEEIYRWDIWATGDRQPRPASESYNCGEFGQYTDYMDSVAAAKPTHYAYVAVRDTLFMSGEGGVGFAAYNNADGTLRGFSNTRVLVVPNAVTDTAWTAYSVTANGTLYPLEPLDEQHSDATKKELLARLIQQSQCVLQLADKEHEIVGFYHYNDLLNLQAVTAEASEHYLAKDVNSYVTYAHALNDELNRLNDLERVAFEPGKDYFIRAARDMQYSFTFNQNRRQLTPSKSQNFRDKTKRFYFEVANEKDGTYYLRNRQKDWYLATLTDDAPTLSSAAADALPILVEEHSPALFSFRAKGDNGNYIALKSSSQIYGHDYDSANCLWILVCADAVDTAIQPTAEELDDAEPVIYDLSGRQLRTDAPLTPGIYIINGKKILVK